VIPLLLNGTRMSSSMYNQVSFLELFLAPDIWSLAFFFRSHATFETLRNLQDHGTRMPSSMYYTTFFSWIIFGSSYLVTCLFLSISCHVWNVEEPAGSWDPHVILYVL
jgi:hypothetical protein